MGLLQPHGRRRRADGQARLKTVTVANLTQARAALDAARAAGEGIALASPPDAAIQYGVLYFVKLAEALAGEYPELKPVIAVDCGDRADLAHDALRFGLKSIVFRGDPRTAEKLADIAGGLAVKFESHSG
jgi:fructose/tagatose bisphosphate aldolase